jgi:hypothetical protein
MLALIQLPELKEADRRGAVLKGSLDEGYITPECLIIFNSPHW